MKLFLKILLLAIALALSLISNPAFALSVNQTFPVFGTGFAVSDEIIYPGNNFTCSAESVDSFPESTALKLRVATKPAPWCKIRVCIPTGLLDSAKPDGTRLPFLISESVNDRVTASSPIEVSPFTPCNDFDRELEFLLSPIGSPVEIKIVGTQWLGAPVPEFPYVIPILLVSLVSLLAFYRIRSGK